MIGKTYSVLLSLLFSLPCQAEFQRTDWLADFHQLEEMISDTYPNLDSLTALYHLDPYEMGKATEARLQKAQSEEEALTILKNFVGEFHDGHFALETPKADEAVAKNETAPIPKTSSGAVACQQMLTQKAKAPGFPFPTSANLGFQEKRNAPFAFAALQIKNKRIALLRIPSFLQSNYPEDCISAWENFRNSLQAPCEKECQDTFKNIELPNRLLQKVSLLLKEAEKNSTALLLDLTNNGGGTDWVGPVIRMLTVMPILCGQFGFIRHPHWVKNLTNQKEKLSLKLLNADAKSLRRLKEKLLQSEKDLAQAKEKCNRRKLWTEPNFKPHCSLVVKRELKDCSPSDDLHYRSGLYRKPLFLLVNNKTASASEDLVGRLQESKAAKILGEKTHGSGCGFTNGGIDLQLTHSRIKVRIPDCARFLRKGTNEVEGIAPDLEIRMKDIDSEDFSRRLKEALAKLL